jgi:DNA repair protein RadC
MNGHAATGKALEPLDTEDASGYSVSTIVRVAHTPRPPRIAAPEDVFAMMRPLLENLDREHFYVVLLTTKHEVLAIDLVSVGSLSYSVLHFREIAGDTAVRRIADCRAQSPVR